MAKDDNYVGAVMSGLGDVLNAGIVTIPIARLKAARDINPTYYSHKDEIGLMEQKFLQEELSLKIILIKKF